MQGEGECVSTYSMSVWVQSEGRACECRVRVCECRVSV